MDRDLPSGPLQSPEEQELERQRDELRRLRDEVITQELKVSDLRDHVEAFNHDKLVLLGRLYTRIDELQLLLAKAQLRAKSEDPVLQRKVQEMSARLEQTREATREAEEAGLCRSVSITREVTEMYRQAARQVHPDHGRTPEERERRHLFMVRLNVAYKSADVEAIQDVMAAWQAEEVAPAADSIGEELVRVIRAIARFKKTLVRLEKTLTQLRARPDHEVMVRVHRAAAEGGDLLAKMEGDLESRISDLEAALRKAQDGGAA